MHIHKTQPSHIDHRSKNLFIVMLMPFVHSHPGYDMSPFIRRYANYLNNKALSYRTVAFDFCKVKRGKEEGSLRTMNADKLLKTLPVLQAQLDALLEFDCQANDLSNGMYSNSTSMIYLKLNPIMSIDCRRH